jgi:hypothetical protein
MAHASFEDIRAVQLDLAMKDVLSFNSPAERAVYLHVILGHKRSAIVRAGVVETHAFKRAMNAYHAGRMLGVVGHPSFLHGATEETLSKEIRKFQEAGKPFSNSDVKEWVYSTVSYFRFHYSPLESKTFRLCSPRSGAREASLQILRL